MNPTLGIIIGLVLGMVLAAVAAFLLLALRDFRALKEQVAKLIVVIEAVVPLFNRELLTDMQASGKAIAGQMPHVFTTLENIAKLVAVFNQMAFQLDPKAPVDLSQPPRPAFGGGIGRMFAPADQSSFTAFNQEASDEAAAVEHLRREQVINRPEHPGEPLRSQMVDVGNPPPPPRAFVPTPQPLTPAPVAEPGAYQPVLSPQPPMQAGQDPSATFAAPPADSGEGTF